MIFNSAWFQIVNFLLYKSEKTYKPCSYQAITLLNKTEQSILFESIVKCLNALVDYGGSRTDTALRKENLDGKLTRYYLNVFEKIQELAAQIDVFYNLTGELKIFELAFQLFYKLTNFIHYEKTYRFIDNTDAVYSCVIIFKV